MALLVIGLLLFIGIHCLPMSAAVRAAVVEKIGEGGYLGLFSLVSLAGIVLIVIGLPRADFVLLWAAPDWGYSVAKLLVPLALYLVIAAQLPGKTRQVLIHPMVMGVGLWGFSHLLVNGDVAGLLLFGGFLGYSALALLSLKTRGRMRSKPGVWWADAVAVVVTVILTVLLFRYHGLLFGVSLG